MRQIDEEIVLTRIDTMETGEPNLFFESDPISEAWAALERTDEDAPPQEFIGIAPYLPRYEVVLRPIVAAEVAMPDVLPLNEFHEPPRATREGEPSYPLVLQPLLTGRRIQIHKKGNTVRVFDYVGEALTGKIVVRDVEGNEETRNASALFLALAGIDEVDSAIFDAVLAAGIDAVAVTDVLRWDNMAAHELPTVSRMELLDRIEWPNNTGRVAHVLAEDETTEKPWETSVGRPAFGGYFEEGWTVVERDAS